MKSLLVVLFTAFAAVAAAQTGTIRGSIIEDSNGETLIGVNVLVVDTTAVVPKGTVTDLDGKFTLMLAPGTYDIQVSYITYQTMTIEDVVVEEGEVTLLENIRLKESNMELQEVVITAEAVRTSEVALLSMKKKSAAIMDGISASKMRLVGDATAVEAAKRVTGVSIEDGKYVYIRGLGDRYTKTTLNGVDIPGLDPDKNSLQMDIFPTNLINNMMVSKNFTAELPADFTGGIMNVETKDFPEERIIDASVGIGFNPDMHFNSDYLTYSGGGTDFLGFDDGTRALPRFATSNNIPTPISGASDAQVNDFVSSFSPELAAQRQSSFMDYSASFTVGDQVEITKKDSAEGYNNYDPKLGYVFSLSYKADYTYYDDVVYGEYQRLIDPDVYELRYANLLEGQMGEESRLLGGLAGLAFKTRYSKLRLTGMHLQSGTSRAGIFRIDNSVDAVGQSGYLAESHNLEYNERRLTNVLLHGEHVLKDSGWEIDWRLSPTLSSSDDPDIRKTAYTFEPTDTAFFAGAGGNPSRIWRNLDEINATGKLDITKNYKFLAKDAKFKFGGSHTYKQRDYEILFFDIQFFGSQDWPNPDPATVLDPENIYPGESNNIYYQSGNNDPNPNAYQSNSNTSGFYFSNEMNVLPNLKTILGLRAEYFIMRHTGRDQAYASGDFENGNNLDNDIVLESFDLFPSVNFIYALTEEQNIRLSYTRTIARPSFKELSFAQILDPLTNRIFNGALFEYDDWNGDLIETRINNVDLRWELYKERGQMFSVSAFYKQFDSPIELVRIPEQQTTTEFQPRNVGNGTLLGVELELRKHLGFIAESLQNLRVSGNVTFVYSRIDMTETEFESRLTYEKTGQTIDDQRAMAGQAPYVINGGLSYSNQDMGLETGIFYNVKGPTLYIVGVGLYPDVYNEPFHSLNFSFNKKLGKEGNTSIDFKVSNLLDDDIESYFSSFEAEDQPFSRLSPGRTFSIGLSHSF